MTLTSAVALLAGDAMVTALLATIGLSLVSLANFTSGRFGAGLIAVDLVIAVLNHVLAADAIVVVSNL